VVFSHITRKQFTDAELDQAIAPNRVICADEMADTVDAEEFQSRLRDMFPYDMLTGALTLPQIDRVRWILFPEVRVTSPAGLLDAEEDTDLPGIMRVMDIQQEQLARSLGDGHRVIHGVAGSGKTMILGYRAEYLARFAAEGKPVLVLVLYYNEPLAGKLAAIIQAKGIADRVHVRHFHKWCRDQLVAYGQNLPPEGPDFWDALVDNVIRAVDRKHIPAGQYRAILIDEGHDFKPAWFELVTQMVDPHTNSLLVLYDDAQNIYAGRAAREGSKPFSFKSVGIQAQGRTTVLKINYRNTQQILQTASLIAADLLSAHDMDDDGVPLVRPVSCGREGPAPQIIRLPSLRDEAWAIADHLSAAHQEGHAWGDMAIFCRHHWMLDVLAHPLKMRQLPYQARRGTGPGNFNPLADSIKLMTMHVSKGLEFAVVALPGMGQMPSSTADERAEARLFYVAATRATHRLVVTASGPGGFGQQLAPVNLL